MQNHLLQIVALFAMEPPVSAVACAEKIQLTGVCKSAMVFARGRKHP